jgi:hypothetical protein
MNSETRQPTPRIQAINE